MAKDTTFDFARRVLGTIEQNFMSTAHSYPTNLIKCSDELYIIEVALAGWKKEEISVSYNRDEQVLRIKSEENATQGTAGTAVGEVLSSRIAKRKFECAWTSLRHPHEIVAYFVNGLLTVEVKYQIGASSDQTIPIEDSPPT